MRSDAVPPERSAVLAAPSDTERAARRAGAWCTPRPGAGAADLAELLREGRYRVGTQSMTLVDTSRRTATNGGYGGSPEREFSAGVWFPAQAGGWSLSSARVAEGGPFPLVIYNHGFYSRHEEAEFLGQHLASHGIVVASMDFPLSNLLAPGDHPTLNDLHNQPGDVSFLIDSLIALDTEGGILEGALDTSRIGVAGMSMGGMTSLLTAYHPRLHDPRVRAAYIIAPPGSMFGEDFYRFRDVPLLTIAGDLDAMVALGVNARHIQDRSAPLGHLITIAGASHTGFASFPMQGLVLSLLGALVAPDGAHPDHPDRLGCGIIKEGLPNDDSFLRPLGGADEGMRPAENLKPCAPGTLGQPAIPPARQQDIERAAALAFFQAHLGHDRRRADRGCRFLLEKLDGEAGVHFE